MKTEVKELKFNDQNVTIIPEGYKWCENCEALTPYIKKKNSFGGYYCCVCNNYKTGILECPNCGAEEHEDLCEGMTIIKHYSGCHFKREEDSFYSYAEQIFNQFKIDYLKRCPNRSSYQLPRDKKWYDLNRKLKKQLNEHNKKWQCGCPRYIIYRNINQIFLDGHYYPSMDYTNAYHWKYKVRCNKCGFVYENDADNC
jgi:hypothetical protein